MLFNALNQWMKTISTNDLTITDLSISCGYIHIELENVVSITIHEREYDNSVDLSLEIDQGLRQYELHCRQLNSEEDIIQAMLDMTAFLSTYH